MQIIFQILPYTQIALGVLLMALILIQQSEASLGSAFGGDAFGSQYRTRRGAEIIIFRTTIVVAILFTIASIANIFV